LDEAVLVKQKFFAEAPGGGQSARCFPPAKWKQGGRADDLANAIDWMVFPVSQTIDQ
jgi:hypothetical protein